MHIVAGCTGNDGLLRSHALRFPPRPLRHDLGAYGQCAKYATHGGNNMSMRRKLWATWLEARWRQTGSRTRKSHQ